MNETLVAEKARRIRQLAVSAAARTHSSHIGGVLSMCDILACLFYAVMRPSDSFVLSKGHTALGLYALLHDRGILTEEEFDSYHRNGSLLIAHASHRVRGVEVSTGSLGHGPAIATGLAVVAQQKAQAVHVYCLLGDGECQEGSVWESLIFIARQVLPQLTLIIDCNGWQGYVDPTDALLPLPRLVAMLNGSGLDVREVNGHDLFALYDALTAPRLNAARVIVAHTVKGKGVSFMEDRFQWHYHSPDEEQLRQALEELR